MSEDDEHEAPPASLRSPPASSERLVGTLVDKRYVLKREIGRGGICAVYAAEHRYTRRTYALKALLPEYRSHQEARSRLLAEARMLGAVHHPNVVEVIDAGMDEGSPFVVMERLRAKSVEALLLARGKLTVRDALVIGRLAAIALAATHKARVIHRDVKPGNLLVVRTESGKTVKLIDFGVATGWEEGIIDDGPPSAVVGTPHYMAPEHLAGRRVTPAADVYAFGATMFECLTGQVPFSGSFEQVYARSMTSPRPDVRKLRPDAPVSLAALVVKCLAAAPEARFPTGVELCAALDEVTLEQKEGGSLPQLETSRRGYVRVAYRAPIEMKLPDGMVVEGAIQDLSAGGLLVTTNRGIDENTNVTVRFALPSSVIVLSDAVVRWQRSALSDASRVALGVELNDLAHEYKQAISDYVRSVDAPS
jgi:serine/threonine protein kinase